MQDIAKKDFENLRRDSDSEPEQPKVVRRGRPPGRGVKKLPDKPPVNGVSREGSSDATLANVDNSCWSNTYNLRVHNPGPSDSTGNATHRTPNIESQSSWFSDLENEFPGMKLELKVLLGYRFGRFFSLDDFLFLCSICLESCPEKW